ncbi:hypothetical protein PROFUN_02476 [Planoprotostelium fungivorum]|uniref:Uncharacterized protein n=1 Tax=Planoprotostelium fungivorum TaxID=1890364 RepID=A0A2P6MP58_9EUKA|nr:hypothetical protein PROFUN_02476 [Planoprotostelium fungivorum]
MNRILSSGLRVRPNVRFGVRPAGTVTDNGLLEGIKSIVKRNPIQTAKKTQSAGILYRSKYPLQKLEKPKEFMQNPQPIPGDILFEASTTFDNSVIKQEAIEPPVPRQVARLAHNLEQVLHSPGYHPIQDSTLHLEHFNPEFLRNIPESADIAWHSMVEYVAASQDKTLLTLAQENGVKYRGSTSSVSTIMTHFYMLASNSKPVHIDRLSLDMQAQMDTFSFFTKRAGVVVLTRARDLWNVDAAKDGDNMPNAYLMDLGKSMECMLTMEPEVFEANCLKKCKPKKNYKPEAYHYLKMGKFLLRAQLDCYSDSIPGPKKTFDLKTRATGAIRYNILRPLNHIHKRMEDIISTDQSVEKEFLDMTRSAFIKYNMQVRIGKMAGIFVAYHNTKEIFGFEYISQAEMDNCLYGSTEYGDYFFNLIMKLFEFTMDTLTEHYSSLSEMRVTFVTEGRIMRMYVENASLQNMDLWHLTIDTTDGEGKFINPIYTTLSEQTSSKVSLALMNVPPIVIQQMFAEDTADLDH